VIADRTAWSSTQVYIPHKANDANSPGHKRILTHLPVSKRTSWQHLSAPPHNIFYDAKCVIPPEPPVLEPQQQYDRLKNSVITAWFLSLTLLCTFAFLFFVCFCTFLLCTLCTIFIIHVVIAASRPVNFSVEVYLRHIRPALKQTNKDGDWEIETAEQRELEASCRSVERLTLFVETWEVGRLRQLCVCSMHGRCAEWRDIVAVLASLTRYADRDFIMLSLTGFPCIPRTTQVVLYHTPGSWPLSLMGPNHQRNPLSLYILEH